MQRTLQSLRRHFNLFGVRGVLRRAVLAAPGRSNEFSATIPGHARSVIIRLGTTDVAAFEHVFVDQEYRLALHQQPNVIVDAGANVGMSAIYFTLRYPVARVFAIEPELSNFEILSKNAKLYPRIVPIHAGLWNHDDGVEIQDQGEGHWSKQVANGARTIPSMTLPTLLNRYGLERVDLLKIDIEGAECELFQDAEVWIGRIGAICIELHDRFRPGCLEAFESATANFPLRWHQGPLECVAR